jgi:excisionase family DNA binding protein
MSPEDPRLLKRMFPAWDDEDEERPRVRRRMSLKSFGLFSLDDAAATLGIAKGTLRNWLSQRKIEYVKLGRRTLITRRALERFLAAQTVPSEEHATAPPTPERQ